MKTYTKLQIPNDSAWNRKTWRRYVPTWITTFVNNCANLVDWLPVIWKDRHWDDYYITKILQRKIELQRNYLVQANRHLTIDRDNQWMTLVLNLIEREHEDYYGMEYMEYVEYGEGLFDPMKSEHLVDYFQKYPNDVRKVMRKYRGTDFTDKHRLAVYVSMHRQHKCRNLIFEILKQKSAQWWD